MWGHRGEDHMVNIGKSPSGCGGQVGKRADELREDEGISWSRIGRMGMIGEWMANGWKLEHN
jgi:hypothetical protein